MDISNKILKLLGIFRNGSDYSTDEKWTGSYWINGKKIYKRTFSPGKFPNVAGGASVPHGISNMDEVVKHDSVIYDPSGGYFAMGGMTPVTASQGCTVWVTKTNIVKYSSGTTSSERSAIVTIYYTCTDR